MALDGITSPLSGFGSPFGPTGRPGWVAPGSAWTSVFSDNRYYRKQGGILPATSVLSVTRASGIILPDAAGVYQSLGNDTLPRTDRGLYANGQFTNLVARLNPTVEQLPTKSGLTNADGFAGLPNSVRFGGGGVDRWGYQATIIAGGVAFAAAFLIQMEDGNPPVFASATATNSNNTFAIVVNGSTSGASPLNYAVRSIGGGAYIVSATGTTPASGTAFGIAQYATNQNRAFRVCGYRLFAGSLVPDALVPGSSDTGGATLLASDIRAVQGTRPSNGQPEPFPGWEAAGLDAAVRLLANVRIDRLSANSPRFIAGAGVDADNLWRLIFDTDNRFKLIVRKSGSDVLTLQTGVAGSVGLYTVDARAKPGDYALTATGLSSATSASAETLPSGATTLRVGSNFALANPFNGWIEDLQILKVAA